MGMKFVEKAMMITFKITANLERTFRASYHWSTEKKYIWCLL